MKWYILVSHPSALAALGCTVGLGAILAWSNHGLLNTVTVAVDVGSTLAWSASRAAGFGVASLV